VAAREKFYITTAISYPNGAPHIGHAYEVVAADAIARFKRVDGYDVFFMTGTDEHGLKVQQTAQRNGVTPKEFVDGLAAQFRAMADRLNCSYDRFIRTTDSDHLPSTHELWRRMERNGDIYLSKYEGWYSVRDEAYYDERSSRSSPTAPGARPPARRWSGSRRRATSSASPPIRTGCWPITRPIRPSSRRRPAATRSRASCGRG
jgi:methionyl-tRNA synthetase